MAVGEGVPVLKLELSSMKHTVLCLLQQEATNLDVMLREAVETACSEGNLRQVVNNTVRQEMSAAVAEEIRSFFRYSSPGRKAIREAVLRHLDQQYPEE